MKSLYAFLTAVFIAAAAAIPVSALDTTDYGTMLNVVHQDIPGHYGGPFAANWDPIWSPDGKTIGFTGNAMVPIFTVPAAGGVPTLIYDNTGKKKGYPLSPNGNELGGGMITLGFTPDGKEIIFRDDIVDPARGTYVGPYDMPSGQHSDFAVIRPICIIQSVNIATGAVRTLVEEAQYAALSPDGRYLAYYWVSFTNYSKTGKAETGLKILDLKTGESWMLDKEGWSPCFTPDSKYVIYSAVWGVTTNLFRIPVTGGKFEQLTFYSLIMPVIGAKYPQVSPDGQWILFAYNTSPQHTKVYSFLGVFNMKTKETFELFPNNEKSMASARWSPDGKKIAYMMENNLSDDYIPGGLFKSIYILDFPLKSMVKMLPTAVAETAPVNFAITGNYPNPFNPSTTISFSLPVSGQASLTVYNVSGQKVRELVSGILAAGRHSVVWDGRDRNGNQVSSGIYISRLTMKDKTATGKMLLTK